MKFYILILALSTIIWGFGFVATRLTLTSFDPYWAHALRFICAGIFCLPFLFYKKSFTRKNAPWKKGMIAASLLFATLIFQTIGLKYTTVAKSGFITTLYTLFVPIILMIVYHKKFRATFWILVFMALGGVALLCNLKFDDLNIGDLLMLFCSFFAALHIIYIGKIANSLSSPVEFNFIQTVIMGVMGFIIAYAVHGPVSIIPLLNIHTAAFKGMIFLSLISSVIAFSIQVICQQKIPPHIAGLIYLLESPFAAWFGFIYFGEILNHMNLFGASLVLLSVCLVPILGREVTTSISESPR